MTPLSLPIFSRLILPTPAKFLILRKHIHGVSLSVSGCIQSHGFPILKQTHNTRSTPMNPRSDHTNTQISYRTHRIWPILVIEEQKQPGNLTGYTANMAYLQALNLTGSQTTGGSAAAPVLLDLPRSQAQAALREVPRQQGSPVLREVREPAWE